MSQSQSQRLRDAELRLAFAIAYLKEVLEEAEKSPLDWVEIVSHAQRAVDLASAALRRLRREIGEDGERSGLTPVPVDRLA